MFQPYTITFNSRYLLVSRHDGADYHEPVPLGIRLNLLRYSLTIFPGEPRHSPKNGGSGRALPWPPGLLNYGKSKVAMAQS
jgi:hypothetical protein